MSESSKKLPPSAVKNEDVIKDLTEDLQSIATFDDTEHSSSCSVTPESNGPYVINPDGKEESSNIHPDFVLNNEAKESDSVKTEKAFDPDNFDSNENEKDAEDSDDDNDIDEIALKDAEVTLTDTEKLERKMKAENFKIGGNDRYKLTEYEESIRLYTEGLKICPLSFGVDRAIIYSNRAAAKMKLDKKKSAIKDCTKSIENDPNYVKSYYRRAQCYESTESLDESLADFNKILELDPQHQEARRAVLRLPPLIEQRNEKLKTEMLGKLKDLGNMFLRPFGLSTENFQLNQDPESKGYSINFKK